MCRVKSATRLGKETYMKCTCFTTDCGSMYVENGNVHTPTGNLLGAVANVTCNTGYELVGNVSLYCLSTGWNGTVICVIQDCGDPTPGNGFAQLPSGTTFGSSAQISCIEDYTLTGGSLVVCLDGGVWSDLPACVKTQEVRQPEADKTFNVETTVVFGVALGLIILVALTALFICIYLKRCKQSVDKTDTFEENTFSDRIARRDHPDGFGPRSTYPSILMAHPPPAPPLKLSQKGNVNVVPPMTKTSRPALGVASVIPTSSNPNGNSHDDLSHVTEYTRRMHTFIDTLQHTAEIASPTHEIDALGVSVLSHQPSSNVSSEQGLSNENTMIVTEARTESSKSVAYGPVSETSKQNVLTEQGIIPDKHSEEEIVSKLPEHKSDIENNMNIYPLPSGIVKTNEKQCQSQTYRNTPATHKKDETAINTEDKENPTISPIHVPVATIDNKQSETGDNTRSSQSAVEVNERQLHKTEESQINHTICERNEIYLTQETIAKNGDGVERLASSQGVHSRTASISSNPAPLMPSVESVVSLEKYYHVNGNADSVVTEHKFSESSDSEIEILVSVSNNKNKTHKKNTVKDRGKITEKHDKSIVSNAEPLRQLRSSYRAGPISAGNYNPAVDKKDTKSKIKQSRNDIKQVKQNTDIVDEKDARLSKMSAIYRSRSPRKEIGKTPL